MIGELRPLLRSQLGRLFYNWKPQYDEWHANREGEPCAVRRWQRTSDLRTCPRIDDIDSRTIEIPHVSRHQNSTA